MPTRSLSGRLLTNIPVAQVSVALFSLVLFGEGFPLKLNRPNMDALFFFRMVTGHLRYGFCFLVGFSKESITGT